MPQLQSKMLLNKGLNQHRLLYSYAFFCMNVDTLNRD